MYAKGIEVRVVGWFVDCSHQVDGIARGGEEKELEDSIICDVCKGPEEIEIAGNIDNQI